LREARAIAKPSARSAFTPEGDKPDGVTKSRNMQKLRGSGSTFSTSGQRWYPFRGNQKAAARNAKLRRLMQAGKLQPMTKQQMRELIEAQTCKT
jgi:hypothetical protein